MTTVMQLPTFIKVVLAIALLGFISLGINQIKNDREVKQIQKIEIKSNEAKLIELDNKYKEVLEHKANTEAEKEEQQKRIDELEKDRERLQRELQAKLDRQAKEQEKLAQTAKKATGTQTAGALASGCEALRSQMLSLGVGTHEIDSAITLAMRESSCNHNARNKSSNACGVYQSLPCGKWGAPGTTEYLVGAIRYTRNRYGDYNKALAHSYANNWY